MSAKINKKEKFFSNNGLKKLLWILCGAAVVIITTSIIMAFAHKEKNGDANRGITEQILSYKGFSRTIGQKEYDFFLSLAMKEVRDRTDEIQVQEKTEELIRLASAQFYLGNKLGICQPYSYEGMIIQMIEENALRKAKKSNGEVIYGPVEYTLDGYYGYITSKLELDIINYLAKNADSSMIEKAKGYYEAHVDEYSLREKVSYSLTTKENTLEYTIDGEELEALRDKDYQLAEFLMEAKEGEEISYILGEVEITGKILSITETGKDFKANQSSIIAAYLEKEYYNELLFAVAENNPVIIEIN